ncbi:RNA polymerase sigma factor [Tunturiibacter gelidiferens]|jgi:RNA polymerase sigma-70 factor (ECF subfamily)|uniref:RNA polymerase sigma factor n=1 Tax=Tunturiibacter gelidiferens TaxID=3069689 RepID=UPI003D9AE6D1
MTQPMQANSDAEIGLSLKEMSDEWLVVAAQGGNIDAFAELRDRHFRAILRTTYRITRNWEDAEDALQDSFLKAFTHLNRFEGRSSFSSWVTRIAINMSLIILRKKRAKNFQSIDDDECYCGSDDRWELRDLKEDPEHFYARHERSEMLKGAIRRLRPCLRNVVELRYAQEHSMHQLADSLGISLAALKSRLFRARLSLRTSLHQNNLKLCQSKRKRPVG